MCSICGVAWKVLCCSLLTGSSSQCKQRWHSFEHGVPLVRSERLAVLGRDRPQLIARCRSRCARPVFLPWPPSKKQDKVLNLLAGEVSQFLYQFGGFKGRNRKDAKTARWIRKKNTAERLDLERICAALPPAAVGGLVDAADVSTGFVRQALLDPSLALKTDALEDEHPRNPLTSASGADWQERARGTCEKKHLRAYWVQWNSRSKWQEGAGRSDGGREKWQWSWH